MTVTRHISIDDEHIEKMRPYMEKYNGNFGAILKDMINQAGKYSSCMNSSAIDRSLFSWMLTEIDGVLIPDNVLDKIIDPMLIDSMRQLEEFMDRRLSELEWDIDLALKYDSDRFPSNILIEMRGDPQKIKLVACILSQYFVKNLLERAPLEIKYVITFSDCIKVELSRSNKKEAQESLITFFGGMDEVIKVIRSRPDFWRSIFRKHTLSNYNMITVNKNYFEDLLADKIPAGEIMIEDMAKRPVQEIPLKEMLSLIKEVYEISRITDRVDIDNDTIIVSHNYRNKEAIEKLKKSLVMLLEASGHLYDAKSTANMIVLMHRPDVGIKINEIVDNLKTSSSRVDQELIIFMAFLKGLENTPDIPISLTALGRRIGKSLMQEYEKENGIKNWELQNFQSALETIDSKLHRKSEWKLNESNLLYTVRGCNIVAERDAFDTCVCHTIRETFKGAMGYAFGNRAQLYIRKLLTHGDSLCEVVIQIH